MAWDLSTEPELAAQSEWMPRLVEDEIEPLSLCCDDRSDESWKRAIAPLWREVKDGNRWADRVDPELGGKGDGRFVDHLDHEAANF